MKVKLLSWLLSICLFFSAVVPVSAIDSNICAHHTEHANCGYIEGKVDSSCSFICEDCTEQDVTPLQDNEADSVETTENQTEEESTESQTEEESFENTTETSDETDEDVLGETQKTPDVLEETEKKMDMTETSNANETPKTIYVEGNPGDGSGGNDSYDGLTEDTAVFTLQKAVELAGKGGTVVVLNTVDIDDEALTIEDVTIERGPEFKGTLIRIWGQSTKPANVTLRNVKIDGKGIELEYKWGTDYPLIYIMSYATLNIEDGTLITGNKGVAVQVSGGNSDNARLNMNGGEISGNENVSREFGAGVFVELGTFVMNGGIIRQNKASTTAEYSGGAGVYVLSSSKFIMNNGIISQNEASAFCGGGVYNSGTMELNGGIISNNTAGWGAGVVAIAAVSTVLDGVTITGNQSSRNGAGLYFEGCSVEIKDAVITKNVAGYNGGGIFAYYWYGDTILKLSGGTIEDNESIAQGGHAIALGGYEGMARLQLSGTPSVSGDVFMIEESLAGKAEVVGEFNPTSPVMLTFTTKLEEGKVLATYAEGLNPDATCFTTNWHGTFYTKEVGNDVVLGSGLLTLTANKSNITYGGSVTYTAKLEGITAGDGAEIDFYMDQITADKDSDAYLGKAALNSGTAKLTLGKSKLTGGKHTIYAVYGDGESGSYRASVVTEVARLAAKVADYTVEIPTGMIYDGEAKAVIVHKLNEAAGDAKIKYFDARGREVEEVIDGGTYTFKLEVAESACYAAATFSNAKWTFTVAPKPIIVEIENAERFYGTSDPVFKAQLADGQQVVNNDTMEELKLAFQTTANLRSDVGEYPITCKSTGKNYDVTAEPATLTIKKASAKITIEDSYKSYTKNFGDKDFVLEGITVSAISGGEGSESSSPIQGSTLIYTVSNGKTLDDQEKAAEDILSVSADGAVSIKGSGKADITVKLAKTDNYEAKEAAVIQVTVNRSENAGNDQGFFINGVEEEVYTYTGKAIKPEPHVYDSITEIQLQKGKDYTVSWKNTTNAYTLEEGDTEFDTKKAPAIVVTGKGNYKGKLNIYYTIQPKNISDDDVTADNISLSYNKKVQQKIPVLKYNKKNLSGVKAPAAGETLTKVKDFTYEYPGFKKSGWETDGKVPYQDAGTYVVRIKGTGNYTGVRDVDLDIVDAKWQILSSATIKKIPNQFIAERDEMGAVTLTADDLQVSVKISGKTVVLTEGIHYDTCYEANDKVGTATVIVIGKDSGNKDGMNFRGTKKATFKITGESITKAKVNGIENRIYDGEEQLQNLDLKIIQTIGKGKDATTITTQLIEGRDYEVTYSNNVKAGTAKMTIVGIGDYTGTIKKSFKISAFDLKGEIDADGKLKADSYLEEKNNLFHQEEVKVKYLKGGSRPEIELTFHGKELQEGTDYSISYSNNKAVTTEKTKTMPVIKITGKGNFKGTIQRTFTIMQQNLGAENTGIAMFSVNKAESAKKGGYISKPVLTDADGKALKEGTDYTKPVYTIEEVAESSEGAVLAQGNYEKGTVLGSKDIVPADTVIKVSVTGAGNYAAGEDSLSTTYIITQENFEKVNVKNITKIVTGREIKLTKEDFGTDSESVITIGSKENEVGLTYGTDFKIVEGSYKNNIKKGTASVILEGMGKYGGRKTIKFKIDAKSLLTL